MLRLGCIISVPMSVFGIDFNAILFPDLSIPFFTGFFIFVAKFLDILP